MTFRHPLDPQTQWDAAATCGKLVAQGVLDVADIVPQLIEAAVRAGYAGDLSGLQSRLTWHVRANEQHWQQRRGQTRWRITQAIAPQLETRAPSAAILAEAQAINDADGSPLLPREVRDSVAQAMRGFLARPPSRSRRDG